MEETFEYEVVSFSRYKYVYRSSPSSWSFKTMSEHSRDVASYRSNDSHASLPGWETFWLKRRWRVSFGRAVHDRTARYDEAGGLVLGDVPF